MVFLKFIKHRGKTRTAIVNQRDNEPHLASSNRARLGNANAPGMKTMDEELTKRTGVDSLRNSISNVGGTFQRTWEILEILSNSW
jgi:hypothetical protein